MCSSIKGSYIYIFAVLLLSSTTKIYGISVTLTPKETRCFVSNAAVGDKIIGSVGLVPADAVVQINLFKVENNLVTARLDRPVKGLDFANINYDVAENGFYSLCLSNEHSDLVTFVVSFRVETVTNKGMSSLSTVEDMKGVITYADRLLTTTREIMERMEAYSTREYLLSKVINRMNSRIVTWSLIQMVVVIGLCCYQIYHISSFFEVKSFV
ncbi:vesicle transport protein [Theileria orientalis strain Shintoku]|uniref:Vesicle transport protein n=1 Tax=Theileria orientalis strain Shintoku TaxID=869250 RepID=J4C321_THEOR|nr:vesicle transport protein [Theileria orientalis strain Shintoku]PVC52451.1 vesicle transport protein [Theileria orientalis]BAM39681.1 vesicle transport protein [Theileria orientalis strain Shintoku]|eukprot:XP_009689982.1 vesicle transport protein [Theileria orientalis strain Shintoku]